MLKIFLTILFCLCKIKSVKGHILTQILLIQKGEKMKKLAIAGASVALAAMPVVSTFAVIGDPLVDTLSIEVQDNCSLAYDSTTPHTNDVGTWSTNTLSASLAAGASNQALGSSAFHVICNNQSGWHVTAVATSLNTITQGSDNRAITNKTANDDGSVYHYTPAKVDTTDTDFSVGAADAGNVATMNAATDTSGKDFTISYTATIGATQAADTYQGTVTYTLVKGAAN